LWQHGWSVVEDAVVDTCAAVILARDTARAPVTFEAFVWNHYRTVRRRILGLVRKPVEPIGDYDPPGPPPDLPDWEYESLYEALRSLPGPQRDAVVLRYFEEASSEMIARALETSEVNARQILHKGVVRLRRCLGERNADER
jgi:RNA polymerase sigma factor (sigma-70 family)